MIWHELKFFAMNGVVSVAIAYSVYRGLVASGMMIEVANSIAYLVGMVYGFAANKSLTFRDGVAASTGKAVRYTLLHLGTLMLNVVVNTTMLDILNGLRMGMSTAFLGAIAVSTVLNFLGMKYWVFRRHAETLACMDNTRIIRP